MTTRIEHLEWCKQRARQYLARGDAMQAFTSMMSDMSKHEETRIDPLFAMIFLEAAGSGDVEEIRRFVEGFS